MTCISDVGKGGIHDPGSAANTVPPLNPIDRKLYNPEPQAFVNLMDRIIQNDAQPKGVNPALIMPSFGASQDLT